MIRHGRVFSIRWIVTIIAVLLTTAVVVTVGTVAERSARRTLTAELTSRLVLEARNLALTSAGVLLSDYPELTLHPLIKEKLAKQPELADAVVIDHTGVIQGHADPHRLGMTFQEPTGLRPVIASPPTGPGELLRRSDRELVVSVPITHASGKRLGHVVVSMRMSYVDGVIERARRQQTLILAISLLVGITVSFFVLSHVLRPVEALRAGIHRIATGDLETPVRVRDGTELGLLADAINEMASGLKRAQTEIVERERLGREMELARDVQDAILPSEGILRDGFAVEGSQRAATEVGGDYYDYFALPDGRIALAVADVSGKGLAGCLVMTMLHALLRADRGAAASPAALLIALDERLSETLRSGSFVTMFYGILDPASGRVHYASAGHNPTLVYRQATGEVECLRARGIPLAAVRGGAIRSTLKDQSLVLEPGDALLQYTDGISEAFDAGGVEQFGTDRMARALRETAAHGTRAVIDGFFERVSAWSGDGAALDDETLLVLTRNLVTTPAAIDPVSSSSGLERAQTESSVPLGYYEEARRRGTSLTLHGGSDLLDTIRGWILATPVLSSLPPQENGLLTTTLYEACANVAEHGLGNDPSRWYELWWVPKETSAREGWFLIRDHGRPFSANGWRSQDFNDPRVRRRGRGLGLEIIHRAMRRVVYYPDTPVGNVTWMSYGGAPTTQEVSHG